MQTRKNHKVNFTINLISVDEIKKKIQNKTNNNKKKK
jgi:hypothetical protein